MDKGTRHKNRFNDGNGSGFAEVATQEALAPDRAGDEAEAVPDGRILDFISGTAELKDTPKEQVRQRIARALFHEYDISVEDMEGDYAVTVGGRKRRIDIAIFRPGQPHEPYNLRRVVICRPEPTQGKRGAVKMRDFAQAAKDIEEIEPYFEEIDGCQYRALDQWPRVLLPEKKGNKVPDRCRADRRLAPGRRVGRHAQRSLACARSAGRPGYASDGLPPLPQLHTRK
jgi:hypothetical protein